MSGLWTKNFQALKNIWLCGGAIYTMSALKDSTGTLRWTLSDSQNYYAYDLPSTSPMAYASNNPALGTSYACGILRVGGSAITPTTEDYNLNETLSDITYLSTVNEKPVWNDSTGEVSQTAKLTIQNAGAEAVTVREWGLFVRMAKYRGSNPGEQFLIYHATLDTPVIIAASQSAMLTLVRTVILTDPVSWPE